jgi:1,4-dihydroxy-6-naphthoate synthase
MDLTLGFSPCPNDCFIFDALVHGRIDTEGVVFKPVLEDVETLNRRAAEGKLDVTKLSFHAFAHVSDLYMLLRSGSALGFNCGPLLVSRNTVRDPKKEIATVAIPGALTTANFLLSIAMPWIKDKREYIFSDIERAVLNGEADAGLIIHENRFTYEALGLKKVADLGEFWHDLTAAPIPLGGIAIRRSHKRETIAKVERLIRKSVEYAFANPQESMPYVKAHSQTMSEEVMKKHIALYVNAFSVDLGNTGEQAIRTFYERGAVSGIIPRLREDILSA